MQNVPVRANLDILHSALFILHLRKAGRYKLAAPVSKTGSVTTEVCALPTPSASLFRLLATPGRATLTIKTKGAKHDNHSSIHAEVAASQATKDQAAKTKNPQ